MSGPLAGLVALAVAVGLYLLLGFVLCEVLPLGPLHEPGCERLWPWFP